MKKEINIIKIDLIVCLLIILAALLLFGCKTKKSTTDFKQTETETVSIVDNSVVKKNFTTQENEQKKETKSVIDKSFFEAWMQLKSDEATFEDKAGNKWTFKNPQLSQKSSQRNDIVKSDAVVSKNETTTTSEEVQQNNVKVDVSKETKTDLHQKDSSKGKELVWLYVVGAVLLLIGMIAFYFYLKK